MSLADIVNMPMSTFERIVADKGATLDYDGNIVSFDSGYMVSTSELAFAYVLSDAVEELRHHYWPNTPEFDRQTTFVGFWRDPQSNYWYVDFSRHVDTYTEAMALAVQTNQIAIWDCKNNVGIDLIERIEL